MRDVAEPNAAQKCLDLGRLEERHEWLARLRDNALKVVADLEPRSLECAARQVVQFVSTRCSQPKWKICRTQTKHAFGPRGRRQTSRHLQRATGYSWSRDLLRPTMTTGIARDVDQLLHPLGFKRQEGAWNRKRDGLIDVVSMQLSKTGRKMTVEAGVLHPVAWTKCWEKPVPEFVDAPECTIRARVADLTNDIDRWWSLDEPGAAADVVDKVASVLLPFIERNHTDEAIERTLAGSRPVKNLSAPETVYLAILQHQRGDTAGACLLLQRFRD